MPATDSIARAKRIQAMLSTDDRVETVRQLFTKVGGRSVTTPHEAVESVDAQVPVFLRTRHTSPRRSGELRRSQR